MFDEEVRGLEVMFCEVGGSKFRRGLWAEGFAEVRVLALKWLPSSCRHQVKNGFETWLNLVRFVVKHF